VIALRLDTAAAAAAAATFIATRQQHQQQLQLHEEGNFQIPHADNVALLQIRPAACFRSESSRTWANVLALYSLKIHWQDSEPVLR